MESKKPKLRTKKPASQLIKTPLIKEGAYPQIARRAYEIYERRLGQSALDDWLQAEREILQEIPHRGGYAGAEQE